jgi:Uma2 family endonuclease
MATTAVVPVSEYLSSSYEVDCDYVDGELQERNVGEWEHGLLQGILNGIFRDHRLEWGIAAVPEQRVQVSPTRYRVPDVCVVRRSDRVDRIVRKAPLICIEILSPEDRWQRILQRVQDYHRMGVENVWIFDPYSHGAWIAQPDGTQQHVADTLAVEGTPIRIELAEVWTEMDEMQGAE